MAAAKEVRLDAPCPISLDASLSPKLPCAADYITGASAIELLPPEKAAALAFVDGMSDMRPLRYARVTVARGSQLDVMEYRVGPLHDCDSNACDDAHVAQGSPITPLVAPGTIPFEKRPVDMADATIGPLMAAAVFVPLRRLLVESFGPVFPDALIPRCGTECFSGEAGSLFPFGFNDILSTSTLRVSKLQFFWCMS
jgi:hypothetical protein